MRWCRIYYRFYMLLLMVLYFGMLYVFYGNLQMEGKGSCTGASCIKQWINIEQKVPSLDIKRRVLESKHDMIEIPTSHMFLKSATRILTTHQLSRPLVMANTEKKVDFKKSCYLDARVSNRTFSALTRDDFIYSAYLDERYGKRIIRLMAILSVLMANGKRLKVFCHFTTNNGTVVQQTATIYEMCENHGKLLGGYILSCEVPTTVSDVCYLNVSAEIMDQTEFTSQGTFTIQVQVTLLNTNLTRPSQQSVINPHVTESKQTVAMTTYKYAVCVPPLFGKIDVDRLIEFIELNRILGFEHFIFYLADLESPDILKALQYYRNNGIVTTIDWKLPSVANSNKIWYYAQLTVHNDCMYRAMSLTEYLAVIDIDEFIVPHDRHSLLPDSLTPLFHDNVAGLSFDSAFFYQKYAEGNSESKLLSMKHNGRSSTFSTVRTKVLVQPARVFEIGIHHVSKPAKEEYQILKVNTSTAFLHHYRACMANFGMKCTTHVQDDTLLKFSSKLEANFAQVLQTIS